MESRHLSGLLNGFLNSRLFAARKEFSLLIHDVNIIAGQVGKSYRFGEVWAPDINPEKTLEKLPEGKPKVDAINHYQGHAHATLTQVALNAARRLHRQKRPPDDFVALQVAVGLLRFVVNARADMARLEAAACEGAFACSTPQADLFRQVGGRLRSKAEAVFSPLKACSSLQDIVLIFVCQVRNELTKPQHRVLTALNRAEEKALQEGNGSRLKQVQDCRKALMEVKQAAQAAKPFSVNEVGAVVNQYYGVMNRYPWYFKLPNKRQSNGGDKGQTAPDAATVVEGKEA